MTIQIGNVGGEIGDTETKTYLDALASWILKNDRDLADRWIDSHKHDYIDLNAGRDFLKESKKYDVVILHNLYHPGRGEKELRQGYYAVSPLHTVANWRKRLLQTGAEIIAVYGMDFSGNDIGDLPGYMQIKKSGQSYYVKKKMSLQAGYAEDQARIMDWVNSFGDPLRLYREIYADPQKVNTSHLGIYWTPEQGKAHSPFGKLDNPSGTARVTLVIDAPRNTVDEAGTVSAMRRYSEREIRLIPGSQVKLVGIIEENKVKPTSQSAKVATRYLQAIDRMTFFHGTEFSNLKGIAQKGLLPRNGLSWGGASALDPDTGAVYLTSDFNLAARYALGVARTQTPLVLEVSITTPKRFKHLRYDPMDQLNSAWDVEESYNENIEQVESDLRDLERKLVKHITGQSYASPMIRWPDEIGNYDGMNLYKVLANLGVKYFARQFNLKVDRKALIQWLHKELERFKGSAWGYLELKPDGTVKLSEEYYYTREQLMYMKGLPPSTIKGVWVRTGDFELPAKAYLEIKQAGIKNLPGEDADRFQVLQDRVRHLIYEDPADMDGTELHDLAKFFQDYDEDDLADYLLRLAEQEPETRDQHEFRSELEGVEMGLNDEWLEQKESAPVGWGKLDLKKAVSLRPGRK